MKATRFIVTQQLLRTALHLPDNARILRIIENPQNYAGDYEFVVEHVNLPELLEGELIPRVVPTIITHHCICGEEDSSREFDEYTWEWN